MFGWVSSVFHGSNAPAVKDVEAAREPAPTPIIAEARPKVSNKKTSVPLAGRSFNFVLGVFAFGRPTWWRDFKSFFSGGFPRLTISITPRNQVTLPTTNVVAPVTPVPVTDMVEIPLREVSSSAPLQSPQPRREQPTKIDPTVKCVSPLPTPPITPYPQGPYYTIADFIGYSPYQLHVNPHYQPAASLSEQWLDDHRVHPSAKKRAAFEACNFGLLTAMCYSEANSERFRILCDYINCLFAFDDLTDEGGLRKDGDGTKKASDIIMNALHFPFDYKTPFRCGQVFSSFWSRAIEAGCSAGTQRRFLEYTDLYVQAIHDQVVNRADNVILNIEDFIILRRDTGALKMCFAMGEFGLGLNLPDEVFECPLIRIMEDCANDVVVLSNDVYSYNIEQAQGDTCNIIEVSMKEKGLDVQGAMDYAAMLVKGRVDLFTSTKAQLPSWGPKVDADVRRYLRVCEDWMTGGFHWSLESKRYFASKAPWVKKTLCVEILPKEAPRGQILIPDLAEA